MDSMYDFPAEFIDELTEAAYGRDGRREHNEIRFRCPSPDHPDRHPSARWNPAKAVWYCDACQTHGGALDLADHFGVQKPVTTDAMRCTVEATYDYRHADGKLAYRIIRKRRTDGGKTFSALRPDGRGGFISGLGDTPRLLYRLPELLAADSDQPVFLAEGEKDADRLTSLGLVATTNTFGAGSWRPDYAEPLQGRSVVILPDNDPPGRKHAETVAASVIDVCAAVRILELPGLSEKGDVSDWLDTGGTVDDLERLVRATPPIAAIDSRAQDDGTYGVYGTSDESMGENTIDGQRLGIVLGPVCKSTATPGSWRG